MIPYILKTVICSALLIMMYFLFLEKEKMHSFNRFYLLFGVLFSFIVPAITIKTSIPESTHLESLDATSAYLQNAIMSEQLMPVTIKDFSFSDLLLLSYFTVTTFLLFRFFINVLNMLFKIRNCRKIKYLDSQIVLTNDNIAPHSFLHYILVSNKDFENGIIEKEILVHESAHVKQRHSLDILLIEILVVFGWINPLLFIYKRAVQLNHEFLADEFVIKSLKNPRAYQLLLLGKFTRPFKIGFTSQFNYHNIKKRIIMMSKKVSFKSAILKQIALIPVFALFVFLFTTKTIAQEPIKATIQKQTTQEGVSQDLINEYQTIVDKYKTTSTDSNVAYKLNISQEDHERLETIFFQMSKEQQDNQMFVFIPRNSMVLPKEVPTYKQLESFKDPKIYGIWLDGKRVDNEILNNYINTDFSSVFISKLMKNAKNYGQHVYQVDLMTNEGYQDYYNRTINQEGNILMPRRTNPLF